MTRIWCYPERHRVDVEGHAGYAPHGQDIVCAGVSTLFYTLVRALREVGAEGFHVRESGDGQVISVECAPIQANSVAIDAIFMAIMQGFQMVADSFPEYVIFTKEGRNAGSIS